MAPLPSGYAAQDGFIGDNLYEYYLERAHGSVGLIITEPASIIPPPPGSKLAHLGLYDDVFVPQLRRLSQAVHGSNARLLIMLDAPGALARQNASRLRMLGTHFLRAAWRAQAADCDGIVLSAADRGVLHMLCSPLANKRSDLYGGSATNRLRLPLEIVEGVRTWLGNRFLIAFRLVAEEFVPEGISLQDARVYARRLVAAGVNLLDVTVDAHTPLPVAQFPGWCVPLASGIKRVLPETPVINAGLLDDPLLADSVIRDGSIDLVMLEQALHDNPYWVHIARIVLESHNSAHSAGIDPEPGRLI